jgi:hypothetical protein
MYLYQNSGGRAAAAAAAAAFGLEAVVDLDCEI